MVCRMIKGALKKVKDIAEVEIQKMEFRKKMIDEIIKNPEEKCFYGPIMVCAGLAIAAFGSIIWIDGAKGRCV